MFIDCADFINRNYTKIKRFVEKLDMGYFVLKNLMNENATRSEIQFVSKHTFITETIKSLERADLSLKTQIDKIEFVKAKIEEELLLNRINTILEKNPDFFKLFEGIKNETIDKTHIFLNLTAVEV